MNVNISAVATAISLSLLAGNAYSSEQNQQKTEVIQSVVDTVASSLEVHIASIEHQPADTKAKCPGGYCYRAEITLTNKGKKRLVETGKSTSPTFAVFWIQNQIYSKLRT